MTQILDKKIQICLEDKICQDFKKSLKQVEGGLSGPTLSSKKFNIVTSAEGWGKKISTN